MNVIALDDKQWLFDLTTTFQTVYDLLIHTPSCDLIDNL